MSQTGTTLLINTSQPTVWVAVVREGAVKAEREWTGDKTLGTKLVQVIEELTREGRPERVAVHRGPGHFMALRCGIITAQLLAQAWEGELIKIAGDGRLDLIQQASRKTPLPFITPTY